MHKIEFSDDIKEILANRFNNVDIYSLDLKSLKELREQVENLREEYALIENAYKVLSNAAYGASAANSFYFYNLALAGDITGECRVLTQFMWNELEKFMKEDLWQRKDLWEKFDFALDESKHNWYREQPVSCYSDTDSVYVQFGDLFKAMTSEYQKKYESDEAKLDWVIKFSKEFLDKQNGEWLDKMYNPRHGENCHVFELETVSKSALYLKKKKYLKGVIFSKGKYYNKPKISGTGIEIIKSTTPKICRKMLTELTEDLMFKSITMNKNEYIMYFNDLLAKKKKEFYAASIDDISQSVGVGNYKKYVIDDVQNLVFEKKAPPSIKAIARYNYLAKKNGEADKYVTGGKIKYYNIRVGDTIDYFGFPSGECPDWAPPVDKTIQWQKNIIEPINRFLNVMEIPEVNAYGTIQLDLFGM